MGILITSNSRRTALKRIAAGMGAVGLGSLGHVGARAADKQLVVVGWGGARVKTLRENVFSPFTTETGIGIMDDSPPLPVKVKAMVKSGNVTWDVLETDLPAILTLVKEDLLEPIDYSKLNPKKVAAIPKELQHKYGIGSSVFSTNIVYNTNVFPTGRHPRTWSDVWDGKRFPGGRTFNFQGGIAPPIEIALLADGVPMKSLYPLDTERAWKSMNRVRPLVTKWFPSHGQAIQLISSGEAAVAYTVGALAITAAREGAPIAVDFNQGRVGGNYWVIVKNSKNAEAAHRFIDYALDAKRQAVVSAQVPYGPTNLEAVRLMSAEHAATVPTSPENLNKQFWWDVDWWGAIGPDGKSQRERQAEIYAAWMIK